MALAGAGLSAVEPRPPQTAPPDDMELRPVSARFFDRGFLWRYRARPEAVIDGDTARLLVDTGFGGRQSVHVRIAGLDAPELREPGGFAAKDALFRALAGPTGDEWPLRLVSLQRETVVSEVRSFERYVGSIFVAQPDGSLVNVRTLLGREA